MADILSRHLDISATLFVCGCCLPFVCNVHSQITYVNSNPWWIGSRPLGNYFRFVGLIDEVRIFSEALTASEILELMSLPIATSADIVTTTTTKLSTTAATSAITTSSVTLITGTNTALTDVFTLPPDLASATAMSSVGTQSGFSTSGVGSAAAATTNTSSQTSATATSGGVTSNSVIVDVVAAVVVIVVVCAVIIIAAVIITRRRKKGEIATKRRSFDVNLP
jgi:hypothetical protein